MAELISRLELLESKVNSLCEENDKNKDKIKTLEQQMTEKDAHIYKVESKVEECKRLSEKEVKLLKDKLQEQEKQIQDAQDKCQKYDKMQVIFNELVLNETLRDQKDMLVELKSNFNVLCTNFKDLEKKTEATTFQVAANKASTSAVKSCQETVKKTAFWVRLEKEGDLTTSVRTRLDHCFQVRVASPCLDESTGWFTVPADGNYLFNVNVCQRGEGSLHVAVGFDCGEMHYVTSSYVSAGGEDEPYDRRAGSLVLRLARGQTVGLYVTRSTGLAYAYWCDFSGCLMSS